MESIINKLNQERLEAKDYTKAGLLSHGTPISQSFMESPTLDELAKSQNVQPMENIREFFGTWPGDKDDGFESDIDELRHSDTKR